MSEFKVKVRRTSGTTPGSIVAIGCGLYAFMWLVILGVVFTLGAICWPYTINSWLEYAGKDPAILWWQGGLLGFVPFVGQLALPAAIITWIVLMFV